jgi:predicted RNA-binding protein (virulence factor B family)
LLQNFLAKKSLKPPIDERPLEIKKSLEAIVHKIGREGIHLVSKSQHLIFVHSTMIKKVYRIGEKLNVKITFLSPQGYSGSLITSKRKSNARWMRGTILNT